MSIAHCLAAQRFLADPHGEVFSSPQVFSGSQLSTSTQLSSSMQLSTGENSSDALIEVLATVPSCGSARSESELEIV
ncbi:hypothetical protein ABH922_001330 [Rhodococcus sp. 27YEA15]|uniref:hypothetical protein n=1 Tax=Rhodococcus sp. 27YEA15 TaxID=3156259 RepID=UPI003C7B6D24